MGGREEREDREPTTQSPVLWRRRRQEEQQRLASAAAAVPPPTTERPPRQRRLLPATASGSRRQRATAPTTTILLLLRRRGIKRGQQLSTATLATAATQLTRSLQLPAAQPPYARTANDRTWLYESRCLLARLEKAASAAAVCTLGHLSLPW